MEKERNKPKMTKTVKKEPTKKKTSPSKEGICGLKCPVPKCPGRCKRRGDYVPDRSGRCHWVHKCGLCKHEWRTPKQI